jgi:peptide/nickel transport system substrate-binding protein
MSGAVYDTLVQIGSDGQIEGALAESWKVVDDTTWEYKLRAGVKYHNGEPFTAQAAKFSLDRLLSPELKSPRASNVASMKDVQVVDDSTIRVHTKTPDAALNSGLLYGYMVPPKALSEKPDLLKTQAIGTGPLKFVEWKKDERVVFERNPDFWGPKVAFERVTYRPIPDDAARVSALIAGEVHLITAVPSDQVPVLEKGATTAVDKRTQRMIYLGLDSLGKNAPELKDKRVRQAINYAVNKDTLIKDIHNGLAIPNVGGMFPQSPGFDKTLKPYPHDPNKAQQLLTEAGYPNGFPLAFDASIGLEGAQKVKEVSESIASDLGKVGIRVKLNIIEAAPFWDKYRESKTSQMYLLTWGASPESGLLMRTLLHSKVRGYYYQNAETDRLLDAYFAALDSKKRFEIGSQLHRQVYDEAPYLFLYQQLGIYGLNKQLKWAQRDDHIIRPHDLSWQ